MTSRKFTPLLLAASVFLTGATGVLSGAFTPAHAITSVDELSDVNQNHWAYEALRDLVEKYDVIEGYPDGTFKGNRATTRWELAAALNAVMKSVGRDIARLGAEKADKTDLQTLARLQEQFRNELTALQGRTSALEARATAIEAKNEEQDNRLTLLEKTQIHGDMSFGFLSGVGSNGVSGRSSVYGSEGKEGIRDAMSFIGRLRLTLDVPLRDDQEDSKIGRGDLHTRLVAAFGRISPMAGQEDNGGLLSGFSSYSRIASDGNGGNAAPTAAGTAVNTYNGLFVENMHYKQHFKDGIPLLTDWFMQPDDDAWETTGDLYVGVVPWRYMFDKSPYRGNENTQFQNSFFVNTPGVAVNTVNPTVAYAWHQKLGSDDLTGDLVTSISTFDTNDAMSGLNLTYEGRLNYNTSLLGLDWDMPGSFYAGGYHVWDSGNNSAANQLINAGTFVNAQGLAFDWDQREGDDTHAFYLGWNQEWYKGIGTTFNYLVSSGGSQNMILSTLNQHNGSSNAVANTTPGTGGTAGALPFISVQNALSAVLSVPMSAVAPGWRDNDVFGVGYALASFRDNPVRNVNLNRIDRVREQVVETYYKWQATENIAIVPSMQMIFNRYGVQQNGTTMVFGLRSSYTF